MRATRHVHVTTLVFVLHWAQLAQADGDSARESYRRGKAAYDAGDFASAARAFAEADAVASNDSVLKLAIGSAAKAHDPILGMALVERAESRGMGEVVNAARPLFEREAGAIVVSCPDSVACSATVDGLPLTTGTAHWFRIGDHVAVITIGSDVSRVSVRVEPGRTIHFRPTVGLTSPSMRRMPGERAPDIEHHPASFALPTSAPQPMPSRGWFWGGIATTTVLGAFTVASAIDVLDLRARFASNRADRELARDGESSELRTNVLLFGTCLTAVATAALGYFVWRSPPTERSLHAAP